MLRVEECRKSECRPVMGRIRIATSSDAKASRLLRGHLWRENLIKSMNAGKQMTEGGSISQEMASCSGAPVRSEWAWLQADWDHITTQVNRLQVRIAKATQAGRWGKVKALQRLLSRSHSGKMLAVKRVTENRGKSTPGVDGKVWSTRAAKFKGMLSLRHHGYRPMPLRRVRIREALRAARVRTAELQPVIVQRSVLRTLMEERAPGLHSLGENTGWRLLDMIELSRRGSNP